MVDSEGWIHWTHIDLGLSKLNVLAKVVFF